MVGAETSRCALLLLLTVLSHIRRGDLESSNPARASRCGESPLASEIDNYSLLSRIVGGTTAKKENHPWIASLKRDGKHFCGGTIVSNKHVLTAAHCVSDKHFELSAKVCIGEHDFTVAEPTEKIFSIKTVTKHPNFNPSRPINYDIAVLELEGHIDFDEKIQPACLPNPDDIFSTGSLCIALGWGRLKENGQLPTNLQQVALPLIDYNRCLTVMESVNQRLVFDTVVCAGFPEGGKDACQGDSGGPFLCQRNHGRWVLVGVTSWGMGCARKWDNNWKQLPRKRGSPAVFTDIQRLIQWVNANLNQEPPVLTAHQVHCSADNGFLRGTAGDIVHPKEPHKYYSNNENCKWTILVPKEKQILLTFSHFSLEWDYSCDLDYLAIYSNGNHLIGKFCGDDIPRPMLISDTNITLKFISDFQEFRTGFALSYLAIDPNIYPDSGCGSVAVIFEEGEIQTMNHPKKYNSNAKCHWIVHGPKYHFIKMTFLAFEVEPGYRCIFDQVVVYYDLAGTVLGGKFCGFLMPDPVLSTSNVMQIMFNSDSAGNFIGFRAAISFVPLSGCGQSHLYEYPQFLLSLSRSSPIRNVGRPESRDVWIVVAGLHDQVLSENTQKRLVKQVIVHPKFSPLLMDFDIALIQLEERLQLNLYIQPICLPEAHSKVEPTKLCVVSGWDLGYVEKSTKLQQLEVPVVLDEVCKDYYGFITDRMFCAGTATDKASNPCSSVSGGPLVCLSDHTGIYFIFGIVSWGVGCKENPKPGVYSRVPLFVEWIEEIIRSVGELKETELHAKPRYESISRNDDGPLGDEGQHDQPANSQEKTLSPDSDPSSDSSSLQNNYVACKDVLQSLQAPGELKLIANSQDNAKGFRCQLIFQAPEDHFIMLHFIQLNMSSNQNSLVIYEGISSNKTFKAQLTEDKIPSIIKSAGPALTIEATPSADNSELRIWLSYTFHNQN
ncbi:ovochymase-2 [Mixophyes fleayi]|uniref:ovochymase-2 n=1 Tax=Mixophyes fleayi TaxID=3061075 RepID=UPI003F4E12C9